MAAFLTHTSPIQLTRPRGSILRYFLTPSRCTSLHCPHQVHTKRPFFSPSCVAAASHHERKPRRTVHPRDRKDHHAQVISSEAVSKPTPDHPLVKKFLSNGLGVVTLKSGKSRLFRGRRATTVYSGAIHFVNGQLHMNSRVVVLDASLRIVGYGLYNPNSLFRVRLLRLVDESQSDGNGVSEHWIPRIDLCRLLHEAVQVRQVFGLPNNQTNAYRVVNADGDWLPGLFVDRFASVAVVSSCAAWCEALRPDIEHAIRQALSDDGVTQIIWRPNRDRLRQDGFELTDGKSGRDGDASRDAIIEFDMDALVREDTIVALEDGVKYSLPMNILHSGQKTGHYADQRDARRYVRNLVGLHEGQDLRVLDLFCYSGGFALNALLGNANARVTALDSSTSALALLRRNAELNGVSDRLTGLRADASKRLEECTTGTFDVVIVDPPKLAPNVKALPRALGKYKRINEAALRVVSSEGGGVLVSCSCSAAVAQDRSVLIDAVREAAAVVGRKVALVKTFGAGADHAIHVGMLETEYLTICVFSVR